MLKIKKIKPMFNRILVTADKYENDVKQGGVVVVTAGTLKEYQKVISVGDTVRGIKEGDFVLINSRCAFPQSRRPFYPAASPRFPHPSSPCAHCGASGACSG